jgi:hypothetical protein
LNIPLPIKIRNVIDNLGTGVHLFIFITGGVYRDLISRNALNNDTGVVLGDLNVKMKLLHRYLSNNVPDSIFDSPKY